MGRWAIILNVYNEIDHVQDVVRSFGNKVEYIIVMDGAYSYYPYKLHPLHDKPYSTDGTIDAVGKIMQDFEHTDIEIVSVREPWLSEVTKKNAAIKNYPLQEGDYYFFVDGHEILEGDIDKQKKIIEEEEWEIGGIIVYNPDYVKKAEIVYSFTYRPWVQWRIFRWSEDLHLEKRHWNFFAKGVSLDRAAKQKSPAVKMGHCEHIKLAHFKRNTAREAIRDLHKKEFGKFDHVEPSYLSYRRREGLEDGEV